MQSMPFRFAVVALGMLAACSGPAADRTQDAAVLPLPEVSDATIVPMATAFAEVPVECRMAVQQRLKRLEMYKGAANGQWSADLGQGLIAYVHATGNMAYGWPSVPGSKGILWSVAGGNPSCPNEALQS